MLIKRSIDETLMKAIPTSKYVKTFLDSIGIRYVVFCKDKTGKLMEDFIKMKYDGTSSVRLYNMKMVTVAKKLNGLKHLVAENLFIMP